MPNQHAIMFNKLKSIFLLLIGSIILAILISFNEFYINGSSTGFSSHFNLLYFSKNYIANILFQLFGISIYIVPIVFLFWSFKLFFNKNINLLKLRFTLTFFSLFLLTTVCYNIISPNDAGIIGSFLVYNLNFLNTFSPFIAILCIILFLLIIAATPKEIFTTLSLIIFLVKFFISLIIEYTNILKKNIIQMLSTSEHKEANPIKIPSLNKKEEHITGILNKLDENELDFYNNKQQTSSDINNIVTNQVNKKELEDTEKNNIQTNNINSTSSYIKEKDNVNNVNKENIETDFNSNFYFKEDDNSFQNYFVPHSLLNAKTEKSTNNSQEIKATALKLESVIKEFGIDGKIVNIQTGPVVTLYEIAIPPGVKTSKVTSLDTDISLRMKAFSVRIAIVPGKDVIGIEIPNHKRQTVYLRKLLENKAFTNSNNLLPLTLGLDISGKPIIADLATMPHLLIAGTTGSGKSVSVNAMILSLLYKLSPEQCKMIMIDPKMLELSIYQDIPHLLTPVVTDPKKAVFALKWAVKQMEQRYSLMSYLGVRNISGYNEKLKDTESVNRIKDRLASVHNIDVEFEYMPYIVIIIDEMADLMLVAGKDIEAAVQRLAQMARAAGIHLIMATQRPSVDVITGTIKANFPTRISFQVSSKIDSRTILGEQGAERLLGKGDMLYMMGVGRIQRIHGPFVSDSEVEKVVTLLRSLGAPKYIDDVTIEPDSLENMSADGNEADELYNEAINVIKQEGKISTSYLQRKFQIGYNRAARIVDLLEQNGVISKPNHAGKRDILI